MTSLQFTTRFPQLARLELSQTILSNSTFAIVPKGDALVKVGQSVKQLPLIISGLVRVFQQSEEREVLMYYVQPGETCTMSLSACFFNVPSPSQAEAEEDTQVLWIPVRFIADWQQHHPEWNAFIISTFHNRYNELLDAFNNVVFKNIPARLTEYLAGYHSLHQTTLISVTHARLANELGTTRVVVSRILKMMEEDGKVRLLRGGIELLH